MYSHEPEEHFAKRIRSNCCRVLQALTLALTLNEKGRATLKKKRYAEALLLLLEADKEFR